MTVRIDLTPEEASALEAILAGELEDTRVELRRTRQAEYHQRVARQLEVVERLLQAVAAATIHVSD